MAIRYKTICMSILFLIELRYISIDSTKGFSLSVPINKSRIVNIFRFRSNLCRFLNQDYNNNDQYTSNVQNNSDELADQEVEEALNDIMIDPVEFRNVINEMYSTKKSFRHSPKPFEQYSISELEEHIANGVHRHSHDNYILKNNASAQFNLNDSEEQDTFSSFFLDPDIYVNLNESIDDDGSIRNLQEIALSATTGTSTSKSNPSSSTSFLEELDRTVINNLVTNSSPITPEGINAAVNSANDENVINSMYRLWNVFQRRAQSFDGLNNNNDNVYASKAEELHQAVFAEEEGYTEQSEIFRESLSDHSKIQEALNQRRMKQYVERQNQFIQSLEDQIDQMEAQFFSKNRDDGINQTQSVTNNSNATATIVDERQESVNRSCSGCGCQLDNEEIKQYQMIGRGKENGMLCRVCYSERLIKTNGAVDNNDDATDDDNEDSNRSRSRPVLSFIKDGTRRKYTTIRSTLSLSSATTAMLSPKQLGITLHRRFQSSSPPPVGDELFFEEPSTPTLEVTSPTSDSSIESS